MNEQNAAGHRFSRSLFPACLRRARALRSFARFVSRVCRTIRSRHCSFRRLAAILCRPVDGDDDDDDDDATSRRRQPAICIRKDRRLPSPSPLLVVGGVDVLRRVAAFGSCKRRPSQRANSQCRLEKLRTTSAKIRNLTFFANELNDANICAAPLIVVFYFARTLAFWVFLSAAAARGVRFPIADGG